MPGQHRGETALPVPSKPTPWMSSFSLRDRRSDWGSWIHEEPAQGVLLSASVPREQTVGQSKQNATSNQKCLRLCTDRRLICDSRNQWEWWEKVLQLGFYSCITDSGVSSWEDRRLVRRKGLGSRSGLPGFKSFLCHSFGTLGKSLYSYASVSSLGKWWGSNKCIQIKRLEQARAGHSDMWAIVTK